MQKNKETSVKYRIYLKERALILTSKNVCASSQRDFPQLFYTVKKKKKTPEIHPCLQLKRTHPLQNSISLCSINGWRKYSSFIQDSFCLPLQPLLIFLLEHLNNMKLIVILLLWWTQDHRWFKSVQPWSRR